MACRVGMTTDLDERKRYWQSVHPTLRDWSWEGPYTKASAQSRENTLAAACGCDAHPGGAGAEYANWYVYGFNY